MININVTVFFVLKGLINGNMTMPALKVSEPGVQMDDGWYWLHEGMSDGKGPYENKQLAESEGEIAMRNKLREIARGAVERNFIGEGSSDSVYDEAYSLGLNALKDEGVPDCIMRTVVAHDVAQCIAQP